MLNRLDKLPARQRLLAGLGIPLLGSLLLWALFPVYMSWTIYAQGTWGFHLVWFSLRTGLLIVAIIFWAVVGATFIARGFALVLVPLAVIVGCLLGLRLFSVEQVRYFFIAQPLTYLSPVLVEAFIGALLGLVVVKRTQLTRGLRGVQMGKLASGGKLPTLGVQSKHRLLLGFGIPMLGGVFLWMLWPFYMHLMMVMQAHWNLEGLSLRSFLLIGAMMLLCGVGAALIARWWALFVVPLALLVGLLLGLTFFDEFGARSSADQLLIYLKPVMVEAFIGAALGYALVLVGQMSRRMKGSKLPGTTRPSRSIQDILPQDVRTGTTPAPKIETRQKTIPVPPQEQHVVVSEPAVSEPDEIARVVAQMQQEYAQAKSERNDGNPKTR